MSKKIVEEVCSFFVDVWVQSRHLLVHIVADAVISFCLWFLLWAFKEFTIYFQIDSLGGKVIKEAHSVGAAMAFMVFITLSIIDIIRSTKKGR